MLRLDARGRLILPRDIREALHWEPGDVVYLHREENGLYIIKGVNPFDALAEQTLREYEAEVILWGSIARVTAGSRRPDEQPTLTPAAWGAMRWRLEWRSRGRASA
ncbi:MAG: AbrB/MazE/SpoVT family DNA-binding domain-containing protein [Bacilli bacterium]